MTICPGHSGRARLECDLRFLIGSEAQLFEQFLFTAEINFFLFIVRSARPLFLLFDFKYKFAGVDSFYYKKPRDSPSISSSPLVSRSTISWRLVSISPSFSCRFLTRFRRRSFILSERFLRSHSKTS